MRHHGTLLFFCKFVSRLKGICVEGGLCVCMCLCVYVQVCRRNTFSFQVYFHEQVFPFLSLISGNWLGISFWSDSKQGATWASTALSVCVRVCVCVCVRARMFAADISDYCFNKKNILKHTSDTLHCGKSLPLTGFAGANLSTGLHT